jgi:hypothetical protein
MPKFIFTYRPAKDAAGASDPEVMAAWTAYFEGIGPSIVDPGQPVFEPATVLGETGESTRLGGYSIVTADDLDGALALASKCPALQSGGGVEVGPLGELPPDHPAERLRAQASA